MARVLRARFGHRPNLVALTTSNGVDIALATSAGFDAQLSKPLEPSALSAALG
jgi:CheY-like chemotaxis protein